jgi:two-component system phosphate regulon sensor histidine kinase PhoR
METEDATPTRGAAGRARRPSLSRRIFLALLATSLLAVAVAVGVVSLIYQTSVVSDAHAQLERECVLVSSAIDGGDGSVSTLSSLEMGDVRVTLVAADGTVLFDNRADATSMPNHADRPEVASASANGSASSERASETAGNVSIYQALRLADGSVLRLSVDRASVPSLVMSSLPALLVLLAGATLVSWLVARVLSRRLMGPVLAIDPTDPTTSTYEELEPLVGRIEAQRDQLASQVDDLKGADLMRRQFTSNVTHELKTPLASISGAAELIRDGIAKPQDVSGFAGRIYDEAAHLTNLVNDILTLSKLDESERTSDHDLMGATEPVDLLGVAFDVRDRLAGPAAAAGVDVAVVGDPVVLVGMPRLLDEMVYNICDNAIRYNHEGGRVDVRVGLEDAAAVLTVSDTGCGIPADKQGKVFERFYRVDPSRSRESGGTGLGLAIVKHAAAFHGASVSLDSTPDVGTTIRVTFPTARDAMGERQGATLPCGRMGGSLVRCRWCGGGPTAPTSWRPRPRASP